jgi:hypothetical protein
MSRDQELPVNTDEEQGLAASAPTPPVDEDGRMQQLIAPRCIGSPARLSQALKEKYGPGNYKVEMRHNTYVVWAHGQLTADEIQRCR